ncbi:hypothetical protein BDN71DRAFT_1510617 [Pleurotus eryngii]|uniref:Helicase C-terminal domain-containing protein n=1 Tax=Pleurotus eryngii TaxID=5323 RepID=A0A9P6DCV3_PLEER|nr:hypothetical protein BDN71DRAFT_1510617 [Pleurotus eryngii]
MTVSYSALFIALITIARCHVPDEDHPAQLIEEKEVMRDLGIPRILDESWVPANLTPTQAARLHHFITKVRRKPNADKADFAHSGTDSVAERNIYKEFFPKISRKINSLLELAMVEHGAHPQEILQTSDTDDFPMPDQLSNLALVPIMITVFGDSVHNGSGIILDRNLHAVAKSVLNLAYVRLRKQWARACNLIDEKVEHMSKLMAPLKAAIKEKDDVRLKDVRMAINACWTVHSMGCWLPGYQLDAEENLNLLQTAVDNALKTPEDAKTDAVSSKKPDAEKRVKRARAAGRQLRISQGDLSNKEEVDRTMQEIITHLEMCFGEDDAAPYALRTIDNDFTLSSDLGVEGMATKSYEELTISLGFTDGRPASWNAYVRTDGRTAWQIIDPEEELKDSPSEVNNANEARATVQPTAAASASSSSAIPRATGQTAASLLQGFQVGGQGFKEQRLLWHQLAGTGAIVSKMWTPEMTDTSPPGTLLADGVGVGKTAQVMAAIAFIQQVYLIERQIKKGNTTVRRPPIIENAEWFMGGNNKLQRKTVPNFAHLIIVPLSLVSQWISELHRFFRKAAIDIFVLPNTADAVELFFLSEGSTWNMSSHKYMNRIVICAHPTFTSLTARTFRCGKDSGLKSIDEIRKRITLPRPPHSIFDENWCSAWIDEAHLFRGLARGFIGSIALDSRAHVLNCITATPLYTQIRDIFNMARIISIPRFGGADGQEWERVLNSRITKEKRANSKADKEATSKRTLAAMVGEETESHTPGVVVRATQYAVIREIQRAFRPHLIRRTMASKQPDGRPLNDKMPSVTSHVISITMTDRELNNLNILTVNLGKGGRTVPTDLNLKNFWLTYRTGVVYHKEPKAIWPIFDERGRSPHGGSYRMSPSSKLDTLGLILNHLLKHDDIEHPTQDKDSHFIWPAAPPVPEGQVAPRRRRILVYHEFTMMVSTISSILAYKGIKTLIMNGTLAREDRDQVIDDFVNGDDPERRVLLFSSVGSVGLNLTCADVVIMLDTIWSQVGIEQIIGRSARLTQQKPVHVYYLIALQTTDVLMSTLAQEKGEMLQTLLTKGTNPALQKILDGEDDDDDTDLQIEVEGDEPKKSRSSKASGSGKPRKPTKAAKKAATRSRTKQAALKPATDEESMEETERELAKGKGKAKATTKQAAQSPAQEEPKKKRQKSKKPTVKSKELIESSGEEAAEEAAKEKAKMKVTAQRAVQPLTAEEEPEKGRVKRKATAQRAAQPPEANVKKRTQDRAAVRDSKKGMSDGDEEGDEDLGKQAAAARDSQQSDEEKQAAAALAPQQPAEDDASLSGGDDQAMDVDEPAQPREPSYSLTPPPCGQPRSVTPTHTGTSPIETQMTAATQGSSNGDPITNWDATQDLQLRTPRLVDICDGTFHPPYPDPPDPNAPRGHTFSGYLETFNNMLFNPDSESQPAFDPINTPPGSPYHPPSGPPSPTGSPPGTSSHPRKHTHSPGQVSPTENRRPRKRTAPPSEEGEDFTKEMEGVRDSSPTTSAFDLATGATSHVDEPVPPLALKPIRSKKKGVMRGKAGSSKAAGP